MWDRGLQENLSHAGKIRLLQMTAYHALLLNTSFPQLALVTIARNEKERFTNLVCRCRQGRVEGPDLMRDWSFIHCVSRTAGNGITSTRQRGSPNHSLRMHTNRSCQGCFHQVSLPIGHPPSTLVPYLSAVAVCLDCNI